MWQQLESASNTLILFSTIGYLTACMILMLEWKRRSVPGPAQDTLRLAIRALAIINLLSGIAVLVTPRPNLGTMTFPLGLLSYTGLFTTIAAVVGLWGSQTPVGRWITVVLAAVLGIALCVSAAWITIAWLPALLNYYQPFLFVGLVLLACINAGLGVNVVQNSERRRLSIIPVIFGMLVIGETTVLIYVANRLLLIFLGLVLNP